jgi:hypothetical protein
MHNVRTRTKYLMHSRGQTEPLSYESCPWFLQVILDGISLFFPLTTLCVTWWLVSNVRRRPCRALVMMVPCCPDSGRIQDFFLTNADDGLGP